MRSSYSLCRSRSWRRPASLVLPALLATTACALAPELEPRPAPDPAELAAMRGELSTDRNLDLGHGVINLHGTRRGQCIEFTPEGYSGQTLEVNVEVVESSQELRDKLQIDAKVSAGFGPFSAEARGNFARSVQFNSNTLHALAYVRVFNSPRGLRGARLRGTPEGGVGPGSGPYALYASNYGAFVEQCGDSYVSSVTTGALFYGLLEIRTASEQEKQQLGASIRGSYGLVSAEVSALAQLERISQQKSFRLDILAEGGAGSQLQFDTSFRRFMELAGQTAERAHTHPVVLEVETLPYTTVDRPLATPPPLALERTRLNEQAELIARDILQARDCLSTYQYILENSSEFVDPPLPEIAQKRDRIASWISDRREAIMACYDTPCTVESCDVPRCAQGSGEQTAQLYTCRTGLPARLAADSSIYRRWQEERGDAGRGGQQGPLGPLLTPAQQAGFNAVFSDFANGSIYYRREARDSRGEIIEGTGKTYVLYGNIRDRWRQLGAEAGPLGFPTTDTANDGVRGRHVRFERGLIVEYAPERTSPEELPLRVVVLRRLVGHWWDQGAARSSWRYPVADEEVSVTGDRSAARFEDGAVRFLGGDGRVWQWNGDGAVHARFRELGGIATDFPVSDEYPIAGGWRADLASGYSIVHSGGGGTRLLHGAIRRRWDEIRGTGFDVGVPAGEMRCGTSVEGVYGCVQEFTAGGIFWSDGNPQGAVQAPPQVLRLWNWLGAEGTLGWLDGADLAYAFHVPGRRVWLFARPVGNDECGREETAAGTRPISCRLIIVPDWIDPGLDLGDFLPRLRAPA
jgi:hypothetical protein